MMHGDLDSYAETSVILILEGVLADPEYSGRFSKGRLRRRLLPPTQWTWNQLALRRMVQWHRSNIQTDVVTFLGPEVADGAAEWMERYGYTFGSIESLDFGHFCDALIVRRPHGVYDSDPGRLNLYGQFGVGVTKGDDFV